MIPPIISPTSNEDYATPFKISVERNNIYFYGEINTQSCEELKRKISDLDFNAKLYEIQYNEKGPPINLHIQSTSGSLMDFSIH